MWFGEKNSEKIGAKVKKNNHCSNIHDKWAKITKGGNRIKFYKRKKEKNDFDRVEGGEIIRVMIRNQVKKGIKYNLKQK